MFVVWGFVLDKTTQGIRLQLVWRCSKPFDRRPSVSSGEVVHAANIVEKLKRRAQLHLLECRHGLQQLLDSNPVPHVI
jgi:hypothetical protein